jgi:hypothetical protein
MKPPLPGSPAKTIMGGLGGGGGYNAPGGPPPKAPMAPRPAPEMSAPLGAPSRGRHREEAKKEDSRDLRRIASSADKADRMRVADDQLAAGDAFDGLGIAGAPEGAAPDLELGAAPTAVRGAPKDAVVAKSRYLTTLGDLARELDSLGRKRADLTAIRLLRQRLVEWVEDLRSVGELAALADAVEHLAQRLSGALAAATLDASHDVAAETIAVAAELGKLAAGTPPPARKSGRAAFWK